MPYPQSPPKHQPILLLNEKQIQQKINRIAYQILEDCSNELEIVVAGIADRGYVLASRLKEKLETLGNIHVTLLKVTLDKEGSSLKAETDIPLSACENRTVIVVDDVLDTGKTLTYGLGVFLNIPIKKLRTVVLVDRSHKLFPVGSDFTGLEISTITHEHVSVVLNVGEILSAGAEGVLGGGAEGVYLQ